MAINSFAHKDHPNEAVLRPSSLAHVVLRSPRFKQMVDFYIKLLGARIAYGSENGAFLQYDHEHHRIAIFNMPFLGEKESLRAGVDHIAFSYDTLDHLFAAYKARKAIGVSPYWSVNHGMTTSMYYTDPDGNIVEFQVDTFATAEEAHDYMQTPSFLANPIGVDYDPDEAIARLEAGESELEILRRPASGPRGPETVPTPPAPSPLVKT
ncbi:MAG: hypothetical protein CYPHOPRED_003751 [Cyphobasidiales sp. Tagirdzhanova-0007]|nr:MAG: hypothetical protein CYPHOPRED_003751 [Cyphobasidiales sp. Tagirdzhanova-0007]